MQKTLTLVAATLIFIVATTQAHAVLEVGTAFAIIPQGGGDIVSFPDATFTNDDPLTPVFLLGAQNLSLHGDYGPVEIHDFTLATDIAAAGQAGLEIAPGQTLFFTGDNGNPGLISVSDDAGAPTRYQAGLHYTAKYDLTYQYAGSSPATVTNIPVSFVYVPEPGSVTLLGSMGLVGGLLLQRRRRDRTHRHPR